MSSTIASRREIPEDILPWYRYGWPWFLISIPLISVGLGSVMLYLALTANNSLVVDDYYKEGKAYNLRIERDRAASLLKLNAVVTSNSEGLVVQLSQADSEDLPASLVSDAQRIRELYVMLETLHVRWVHVTQAERDGEADLQFIGGGRYIAQGSFLPEQGKYRLHIQPRPPIGKDSISTKEELVENSLIEGWRLISSLTGFTENQSVSVPAPEFDKVFTKSW